MATDIIIPPVNSKGTFIFDTPFDTMTLSNKEYIVKSVRHIKEMIDSGDEPYKSVYIDNGLTEDEYKSDLDNNIPIVVFVDNGNQYLYIPASKIKSMPITTGIKYQETMLAINLGFLPLSYSLEIVKDLVKDTIKTNTGIESNVEAIVTSAVHLIPEEKDKEFMVVLEANKKDKSSYAAKYNELATLHEKTDQKLKVLEEFLVLNKDKFSTGIN